jgi:hypothetical protein
VSEYNRTYRYVLLIMKVLVHDTSLSEPHRHLQEASVSESRDVSGHGGEVAEHLLSHLQDVLVSGRDVCERAALGQFAGCVSYTFVQGAFISPIRGFMFLRGRSRPT